MIHAIANKSALVMVIEPVTGRRIMLNKGIGKLGFAQVVVFSKVEDALAYLDSDEPKPNRIVTTLLKDKKQNGFTLLSLTTRIESMQNTLISFLVSEDEKLYLPTAFEIGLYSWHENEKSVDELIEQFKELFETADAFGWNDCLTSAHYLRAALAENKLFADMAKFELELMSVFPDQPWLVINLAQALLFDRKPRAAMLALNRAKCLAPEAQEAADKMITKVAKHMEALAALENTAERLGVSSCMIIDPDNASNNTVKESYEEMGIPTVHSYADGQEAWDFLAAEGAVTPDVIIMEWRLPRLSGSALLQRIKGSVHAGVPVIIFTSLLKDTNDKILVKEMGVLEVLDKPSTKTSLKAKIDSVLTEDRRPKDAATLANKIRTNLRDGNVEVARDLYEQLEENEKYPDSAKKALCAELSYHSNQYEEASKMGIEALQFGGESIHILNLLGKTYMKLRFFEQSVAFFDRAKKLSPNNIARLCDLAEVQTEMGDHEDADLNLENAAAVDEKSEVVNKSKVVVALGKGEVNQAKEIMNDMDSVWGVVAFMNNRAVALANEDQFAESISLYKKAIMSFPEKFENYQAILHYNLALAQIKSGEDEKAFKTLRRITTLKVNSIKEKTSSLYKRAKVAIESGKKLKLSSGPKLDEASANISDDVLDGYSFDLIQDAVLSIEEPLIPMAYGIERGDMRCHMIYRGELGICEEVIKMLAFVPNLESVPS